MTEIFTGTEYWANVVTTWESSALFWDGLTTFTEYTIGVPTYTEQSIGSTSFTDFCTFLYRTIYNLNKLY